MKKLPELREESKLLASHTEYMNSVTNRKKVAP